MSLPTIPQRSHLYSLEPKGLRTVYSEGLLSYIARLADIHSINIKTLLTSEFFSKEIEFRKIILWKSQLNICSGYTDTLVKTIERLTLRSDIKHLSLARFSVLFFAGLCHGRSHRVWCPLCYQEASTNPYDQLVWTFDFFNICNKHSIKLESTCPECKNSSLIFDETYRPGFCGACGHWLGDINDYNLQPIEPFESPLRKILCRNWLYDNIGKLIEILPEIKDKFSADLLRDNIITLIDHHYNGNLLSCAKKLKLPEEKLEKTKEWLDKFYNKESNLDFHDVLFFSDHFDIPFYDLFINKLSDNPSNYMNNKTRKIRNVHAFYAMYNMSRPIIHINNILGKRGDDM